jgi:hypothetical protein
MSEGTDFESVPSPFSLLSEMKSFTQFAMDEEGKTQCSQWIAASVCAKLQWR